MNRIESKLFVPRRMSRRRGTNRPTFHQQMRVVPWLEPMDAVEIRLAIFDTEAGGSADDEAEDSRL